MTKRYLDKNQKQYYDLRVLRAKEGIANEIRLLLNIQRNLEKIRERLSKKRVYISNEEEELIKAVAWKFDRTTENYSKRRW